MMESENKFGITDYVVFALSLVISLGIGVYSAFTGRKQKTTKDFYFGSGDLNIFAVALSMAATFLSAIAILGYPSEVYFNGINMAFIIVADLLAAAVAIFVFIPFFYNLGLTSVYENVCMMALLSDRDRLYRPYFELRFNRLIRRMACFLFIVNMLLYIAIVLYAPSLALSQSSGIPLWVCIVSTGVVCTIYTAIGGMKAVVWTDAFQMVVMFFGVLTIMIVGVVKSAGISKVWEANMEAGRLTVSFNKDPTIPHTFWTLVIGGFFNSLPVGLNQATVQRYFSVKSERSAQKMFAINAPVVAIWKTLLLTIGLLTFAYYEGCDPLMAKRIQRPDQISALFVLDTVSFIPGFAGLFTAIVCSATLSTVSSGVNSIVVVINEDFIKPALTSSREGGGETFFIRLSKWLSVVFGCTTIGMAFGASFVGRGLIQFCLSVNGMCGGPILGLFFCGFMLPFCNAKGAGCGLIVGLITVFWIGTAAIFTLTPRPPLPLSTESCPLLLTNTTNSTFSRLTEPPAISFMSTNASSANLPSATLGLNCSDPMNLSSENCLSRPETFTLRTLYSLSYQYYSLTGFTITVVVATIISFLTGRQKAGSIPDSFLLYRMLCGSRSEDTKRKNISKDNRERPYVYKPIDGLNMSQFDKKALDGMEGIRRLSRQH